MLSQRVKSRSTGAEMTSVGVATTEGKSTELGASAIATISLYRTLVKSGLALKLLDTSSCFSADS